jgi:hypothetical protein
LQHCPDGIRNAQKRRTYEYIPCFIVSAGASTVYFSGT